MACWWPIPASAQYAFLYEQGVQGSDLSLEWARALSWVRLYDDAVDVLVAGLESDPENVALQLELARNHYYAGRLEAADAILAGLSPAERQALDVEQLYLDVRTALTPAVEPEPPPLTLLQRATRARERRVSGFDHAAA